MPFKQSDFPWTSIKSNSATLCYTLGLNIPKVASPWLVRTKIGTVLLIPFQVLVMSIVTIPCLFMELALGQYSNKATVKVWDLCPVLRGIGVYSFITFLLNQIHQTFACNCLLCFMILSFTKEPIWKSCNNSWNSVNCFTMRDNYTRRLRCEEKYPKEECDEMQWQSSVDQFYLNNILNVGDGEGLQQELLIYGLVTTLIIFLANISNSKFTENILIALLVLPTIQLIILFFVPLVNSNGFLVLNYLVTQFDKTNLSDLEIWTTMVEMSLSTSGLGLGAYIVFGTKSSFRNPIHFKTITLSLINVISTIIYTIIIQIFVVSLGLQSKMILSDVYNLEQELSLPEALFFLEKSSRVWTTIWLSNCYMIGLRSLIVMMSINGEVVKNYMSLAKKYPNFCTLSFSVLIYVAGIYFSAKDGYIAFKIIDKTIRKFIFPFVNTCQLIGVMYFYGFRKFRDDIHFMLGIRPSVYWMALFLLNPIFLGSIWIYNLHEYYYRKVVSLPWIYKFENVLLWSGIAIIIVCGLAQTLAAFHWTHLKIIKPEMNWGPRLSSLMQSRKMFDAYHIAKEYLYRQERFRDQIQDNPNPS